MGENRFASLQKSDPKAAEKLFTEAEKTAKKQFAFYQKLTEIFDEL